MPMSTAALIALGSNLGDRRAHLDAAVAALASRTGVSVRRVSAHHETAPAGGPAGQGAFLNAAALVRTTLGPIELLRALQAIESEEGRVRAVRWGERTLDLDLILYGKRRLATSELTVPHPRMAVRRFVLAPAVEIAAGARDPATGRTLADLLANLDRRPGRVALFGPPGPATSELYSRVVEALDAQFVAGIGAPELLVPGPTPDPGRAFDRAFRAAVEAASTSARPDDQRWIVYDGWIDQYWVSAMLRFASSTCSLLPFRDAFIRIRPTLPAPTFAAFWDPPGVLDPAGSWARLRRAYSDYLATATRRDPALVVEAPDPASASAEILAACAASRPDGSIVKGARPA